MSSFCFCLMGQISSSRSRDGNIILSPRFIKWPPIYEGKILLSAPHRENSALILCSSQSGSLHHWQQWEANTCRVSIISGKLLLCRTEGKISPFCPRNLWPNPAVYTSGKFAWWTRSYKFLLTCIVVTQVCSSIDATETVCRSKDYLCS